MRKDIRDYVDAELRYYLETKKDLIELREEILESTGSGDESGIRGTDISNITERKGITLITNKRLKKLEETIRAIDTVVSELDEEKYKLIELKYWKRPKYLTDEGIARELNIGRTTYYRHLDDIRKAIAIEFGLINAIKNNAI